MKIRRTSPGGYLLVTPEMEHSVWQFLVGTPTCSPDEFPCPGGDGCIDFGRLCDGRRDCSGGEDEMECGKIGYLLGWRQRSLGVKLASNSWYLPMLNSSLAFIYHLCSLSLCSILWDQMILQFTTVSSLKLLFSSFHYFAVLRIYIYKDIDT